MAKAKVIFVRELTREINSKDGKKKVTREVATLALQKGQKLFINDVSLIGRTVDEVASVEELESGHALVTFNTDAIATVEELHENLLTARNLRFARPNLPGVKNETTERIHVIPRPPMSNMEPDNIASRGLAGRGTVDDPEKQKPQRRMLHGNVRIWPKAALALKRRGHKVISIPGGLQYARAFCHGEDGRGGEMIIAVPKRGEKVSPENAGEISVGYIASVEEIRSAIEALPPEPPKATSVVVNQES